LDYSGLALSGGVSGLHTDAPDQSGATVTNAGRVYVKYGSNILKGGVAYDGTNDEDLRHSQRWTGSLDLTLEGWAASLNAATRKTSFDSFPTDVLTRPRTGAPVEIFANAQCTLHDREYGGSLGYNTTSWSVYTSGTWSDYGDISCGYDRNVPNASSRFSQSQFQQLAGTFLSRAATRAGGRLGDDTKLLSSQVGAGASYHWERFSLAFDYTRSQGEFGDVVQNSYAVTGTFTLNSMFSVDVTGGLTSGDQPTNSTTSSNSSVTPYGGLYLTMSF
jgi:hypothetical protein